MKSKMVDEDFMDEIKELINQGQTKVDEVRTEMKRKGLGLDRTCKMQLIDDCKRIEKYIKKIQKGDLSEKNISQLQLAILLLETTSNGILSANK